MVEFSYSIMKRVKKVLLPLCLFLFCLNSCDCDTLGTTAEKLSFPLFSLLRLHNSHFLLLLIFAALVSRV